MDWNLVSYVVGSKIRFSILLELNRNRRRPTELSHITGAPLSHVSLALKELEAKNLVECLTPEQRKNRFYGITESGKELLNFIRREINPSKEDSNP